MNKFGLAALLVLLLGSQSAMAALVALPDDGTWFEFVIESVGDPWRSPADNSELRFEVHSSTGFTLRVVDLGFGGDQVSVGFDSTVLGSTSPVPANDGVFAFTPEEALADPATWSQGSWILPAGDYVFSGAGLSAPFGSALFAISVEADGHAVPEPATGAIVLSGLPALWALARRRALGALRRG